MQRHPRTQRQQVTLRRPGQRPVLLPPLRLQALRARRRRRTPQAAAPRHAPEALRTAPALPPSHLRPCPDATLREPGTLLEHRALPAAGTAAHPAHHRRDGAPAGEQPGGELHLLQLLRERDARQHQVPQRPETLHDGEGRRTHPLQRGQHPRHPGVHHHRRRVRRGSHHRRRTQGRHFRARRRPEQPHVAGPLRGVALRRQAGHLHRRRRGPGRAVAPAGTHAPPRSGTLPHRALRRGLQGCQRASGEIRRRKPPHLHRASRRSAPGRHLHRRRLPRRPALPLRERPAAGCRHRLGQLRRTLHLRAPPPAGDDRTPRRRQVRIHRRAGAAPLPAPRVENRLLQPRKHAHRLPPAQAGGEADRPPLHPRTGHDGSRLRAGSGLAGPQRVAHPARRRELRHRPHPGESPPGGAPQRGAHPRHRPHEPPGTTSGTGADGNGLHHRHAEQAGTLRHPQPVPRHPRGPPPQGEPQRKGRHPAPRRDERHQRLRQLRQHVRLLPRGRP